jgi:GT2 family glycosyltransferase
MYASIIIPTLGRSESYRDCIESLWNQTNQNFEIIKVTEEGSLAALRNEGAKRSKGDILIFIDDDVLCESQWLDSIFGGFKLGYKGVSGPSFTKREFRSNRDCFRFPTVLFSARIPGKISSFGQWSLEATKESCRYEGEVDYLEACNMAFDKKAFWEVGGFDESYGGIGDWSEPDLCFRLRRLGYKLWFSRDARVEHRPSKTGAYKKRLKKCNRMENYELFSKRWIKPNLSHSIYKCLFRLYFWMKEKKWI